MPGWFPGPGWEPWDALVAAGVHVFAEAREPTGPGVLMEVRQVTVEGRMADCMVMSVLVRATCVTPSPDTEDTRRWMWTVPVPVLLPYSDDDGATAGTYEDTDLPSVEVFLPHTYQEV